MNIESKTNTIRGRGISENPANRFEKIDCHPDPYENRPEDLQVLTEYFRDYTRSIITSNDSPDVYFDKSINPYRGCEHGCIYCYARPYHEYLGLSAGLDFETRIFVKEDAARLLRKELSSPSWKPQKLSMSGVTDPYQPIEKQLQITRRCLEVLLDFHNPVQIVTKSHLVSRDIDLLAQMARRKLCSVHITITTLDAHLSRIMEPRAAQPHRRLDVLRKMR
jgi:DNA repair photolyase